MEQGRFRFDIGMESLAVRVGRELEWIFQRSCACSIPGSVQGRVGQGLDPHGTVEGVPTIPAQPGGFV